LEVDHKKTPVSSVFLLISKSFSIGHNFRDGRSNSSLAARCSLKGTLDYEQLTLNQHSEEWLIASITISGTYVATHVGSGVMATYCTRKEI